MVLVAILLLEVCVLVTLTGCIAADVLGGLLVWTWALLVVLLFDGLCFLNGVVVDFI